MLEQTGTVIDTSAGVATVECSRQSACGHCSVGSSCGTSVVAELFGKRASTVRVKHELELAPGDRVVLGIAEDQLLRAAFRAYMLPLLVMMLAGVLLSMAQVHQALVVAGSLAGLAAGLLSGNGRGASAAGESIRLLRKQHAETVAVKFEYTRGEE